MSSTFGGIQQAANSIGTARYGLEVVSQNIANASTPGYTRQASQQASVDSAAGVPSIYTRPAGLGGVVVSGTARLTDPVLDSRARTEHSRGAQSDANAAQLASIENVFPEPSNTGLGAQLNDFWNAWTPVANDPGSAAARTVLLQSAATVASTLNAMSTSLSDLTTGAAQSLNQDVAATNSAATQLGALNAQIAIGSAAGANTNSLLDQRDQILDRLSTLVGAVATINPNGSAEVSVGGQSLVSGTTTAALTADATFTVSVGGTAVALAGGSAAAEVTALTATIPGYQSQLNSVATALSSAVNAAQNSGFDANGNAGTALFSGSSAATIAVAITDPALIAAATTPGGNLDGANALTIAGLGTTAAGPDHQYATLVGDVASSSALAQQQQATQASVTAGVDTLRTSVSGVNYDEEVSNMLTYQRAFQASSRVLTTLDGMLDTLINHTGLVGLS